MKKLNKIWSITSIVLVLALFMGACKKTSHVEEVPQNVVSTMSNSGPQTFIATNATSTSLPSVSTSSPYVVTLESINNNGDGTYTWIWSVLNPNPGNGLNGTVQDLSHWDITLGQCATMDDVVSASMSEDGINWMVNYLPAFRPDPSQNCFADSVIKFDLGTRNNIKSYYQLTVNKNFSVDTTVTGVYKSGNNTRCGTFQFSGLGCPIVPEVTCAFSQGYFFAKPDLIWASNVTIGGYTYTQAEGKAIWNTSNKGGIRDSKAGFLQVAAIKLSGTNVAQTASVWADVAIVENYLSGLGKLSPTNLPTGDAASKAAAGRIGDWIDQHHCSL